MAIYNGGLNIKQYTAGTGIDIDSNNAIHNCNRWNTVTQGATWSRICFLSPTINTEGLSGILSISCTRSNVVCNATFIITTSHNNVCNIIQISSNNYTIFKIRGIVNSSGYVYIELYDDEASISTNTSQTWHCSWIPLLNSTLTPYTSFTSGASVPSGYVIGTVLTTSNGNNIVADQFVGKLTGNAATATKATQDDSGNVITTTYATKTELSNYIPNFGSSMSFGDGTAVSVPSAMDTNTVYSWKKSTGSRDTNIMYSSQDGMFIANSGDCGYVFAVYNTDITTNGNFSDTSAPIFKVNDSGSNNYCEARYGFTAPAVYGAVANDLADSIPVNEDCILEPGYCYCFDGEKYAKSSKYLDDGIIGIHSDTYGFKMGHEKNKKKMDVAVSGFVLVYIDKEYKPGTPLTCTENGYLTEIKKEDKIEYPEKIVATYWKNEPNEEWGIEGKKVKVNGRKWVKIK